MTIEFMTGATVFALIDLVLFLVVAFFVFRLVKKYWMHSENETDAPNVKVEVTAIAALLVFAWFFNSSVQPKVALDPVANRQLIEYQDQAGEVVINTPAPRTETLEGFSPLKD